MKDELHGIYFRNSLHQRAEFFFLFLHEINPVFYAKMEINPSCKSCMLELITTRQIQNRHHQRNQISDDHHGSK
jgi:hypothetical protein